MDSDKFAVAEYGKLRPPEPKDTFKKGQWKIIARIYISLILLKLFIMMTIGDTYWQRFLLLLPALIGWRTVIDAVREDGKIRILKKMKGLIIVYKDKQPNYYWFCIVWACLLILISTGVFLATP